MGECSTELSVGCVVPMKEANAATLRRHFHGVAVYVKEEKVAVRVEVVGTEMRLVVRTKSQVLYEERMSVATAFPGRRAHRN